MKKNICILMFIVFSFVFAVSTPVLSKENDLMSKVLSAKDIRDVKGPILLPSKLAMFGLILLAVIALIIIYRFVIVVLEKRKRNKTHNLKKPHEVARERLNALSKTTLIQDNRIKEYFTELSDIIRVYLEKRFALNAPEMTTEEFLFSLRDSDTLAKGHKNILKEFLTKCDLVKFAKYGPDKNEIGSMFSSAIKLVDDTAPSDTDTNIAVRG